MQRNDALRCRAASFSVGNEASPAQQRSSSNQKQTPLIREERKFQQTGLRADVGPTEEDKEEESLAALPGFNDLAPKADLARVLQ